MFETAWKRTGHCQVHASPTCPESRVSRTGCAMKLVSLRFHSCQEFSWICSLFRLRAHILVLWRSETINRGPQPWSGITYSSVLFLKQHLRAFLTPNTTEPKSLQGSIFLCPLGHQNYILSPVCRFCPVPCQTCVTQHVP